MLQPLKYLLREMSELPIFLKKKSLDHCWVSKTFIYFFILEGPIEGIFHIMGPLFHDGSSYQGLLMSLKSSALVVMVCIDQATVETVKA